MTKEGNLSLCPFCGTMPEVISRGNEHTKRSVTIRCASCRAERTDAGIISTSGELLSVAIGNWNQRPTPPPPAGAGTETAETDAFKSREGVAWDGQWITFARQLEQQRDSLRRQAEADRATIEELKKDVETLESRDDTLWQQQYREACIKISELTDLVASWKRSKELMTRDRNEWMNLYQEARAALPFNWSPKSK